ncbi:unnamed protein product [Lactuca saligna]|uniref:Transmembrane 9 superfamily member n=1 Tax=Lactuca saligna TaxID=75948 RepID=A0AA36E266_LACSI|nr:unnamed protein product [Lactuca saligna]
MQEWDMNHEEGVFFMMNEIQEMVFLNKDKYIPPKIEPNTDKDRVCTSQTGDLTKPDRAIDGIFGFGQQGLSVIVQLSSQGIAPDDFSDCLVGNGGGGGILVLGQIIEPTMVYTPLIQSKSQDYLLQQNSMVQDLLILACSHAVSIYTLVPGECIIGNNNTCTIEFSDEVFLMIANLKSSSKRMWRRLQFVSLNSMKQMLSTLRKLLTITIGLSFSWMIFHYGDLLIIHVNLTQENPKPLEVGKTLDMTYSVKWTETNITFARRFEVYLDYHFFEHRIHWFSIFNSFMMVIFLTGLVSTILIRSLRNDYAKYAREDDDLESLERDASKESGWKLVHGDVFRPPCNLVLLSVVVGTGAQLALLILLVILFERSNCDNIDSLLCSQTSFYFGYTAMFCLGLGILCVAVGYLGSNLFVRRIYQNIKYIKMVQEKENVQLKRINTGYEKTKLQLEDHEKKLRAHEVINERENKKFDTEKKMVLRSTVGNFGVEEEKALIGGGPVLPPTTIPSFCSPEHRFHRGF